MMFQAINRPRKISAETSLLSHWSASGKCGSAIVGCLANSRFRMYETCDSSSSIRKSLSNSALFKRRPKRYQNCYGANIVIPSKVRSSFLRHNQAPDRLALRPRRSSQSLLWPTYRVPRRTDKESSLRSLPYFRAIGAAVRRGW